MLLSPIFIGGCMRSGTTMLGAMLGSHPERVTTPETQFKSELFQLLDGRDISGEAQMMKYFSYIENSFRFKIWGVAPLKSDFENKLKTGQIETSYRSLIDWFVRKYGEQKLNKFNCKTWVDHSPYNVRYASKLLKYYPEAKFVHILRDGRGVSCSYFNIDWGPCTINQAADIWKKELNINLNAEKVIPVQQLVHVKYEDLVANPSNTLKQLCEQLKIEYVPEMTEGNDFVPPAYTVQQHALVGSKPNKNKGGSWKSQLTSRQQEIFETIAGEELKKLGYPTIFDNPKPMNRW